MAGEDDTAGNAQIDLAHFEARMGADGRLLHYALGRRRTVWLRQTLTGVGVVSVMLLAQVSLGLILLTLALAGEAVDFLLLGQTIRNLERGNTSRARLLAGIGAAAQGLTIAACVAICWRTIPVLEARFFAAAFLISATMNAGIARPHFVVGANLRLAIFTMTAFAMLAMDLHQLALATSKAYGFFAAGFGLLCYISLLFIQSLEKAYHHRVANDRALLRNQHAKDQARAALAQSVREHQRLALVAKYANDSILISDADGRIDWVNDAFSRITEYSYDEAVGQFPASLLNANGTDPATVQALEQAIAGLTPIRVELLNRTRSGRLIWMETSKIPITDQAGQLQLWIAVEREITEAKEREAELARARLAAEEAGQSKSQFLANMSHEIRTPMNGVIGVAELLLETRLDPVQADYVDTILESGRLLLGIINDILDVAKLQSGKATLDPRIFSPHACLQGVIRILGPTARKKGISLILNSPDPTGLVVGDDGKLRQIIVNLVGNAIKFTQSGAVTIDVTPATAATGLLRIDVRDTGIGIAPDRIDAVFESFSQADNGIGRQFGGTGLGLTICAMLAEKMGGGISVRSELGKGSVFTISVSMPATSADIRPVIQTERRAVARLRPGLRVLVAEDNRTNMMIVRKMLAPRVHSLIEAANGEVALTLYQQSPPDLVLMDVSMPVKDGLQATRDIRALEARHGLPRCPIVALTANAFGEDRDACRLAGLDGFLVKPLSRDDLLAEINIHCPPKPKLKHVIGL